MTRRTLPDLSKQWCRGGVIACSCPSQAPGHRRRSRPRARRPPFRQRRMPLRLGARVGARGPGLPFCDSRRGHRRGRALPSPGSRPGAAARERGHRPAGRLVHPQSVAGHLSRQSIHRVFRPSRRWSPQPPDEASAAARRTCCPLPKTGAIRSGLPDGATIGFFAEGKLKLLPLGGRAAADHLRCAHRQRGDGSRRPASCSSDRGRPARSRPGRRRATGPERDDTRCRRRGAATSGLWRRRMAATSSIWRNARTASSPCSRRWPRRHGPRLRAGPTCCPRDRARPVRGRWSSAGSENRRGRRPADWGRHDAGPRPTVPLPGRFFDGRFSASSDMVVYLDWKAAAQTGVAAPSSIGRDDEQVQTVGEPAGYFVPKLPDGSRLAVARRQVQSLYRDIWVLDLTRGARLSLDGSDETNPEWSMDGLSLLYTSDQRGERDIDKRLASGEGSGEPRSSPRPARVSISSLKDCW